MSVMIEFSVVPLGKGASVSTEVAAMMKIVIESGVRYRANPMGTVLEGEWDEVMAVVKLCHNTVMQNAERAVTTIKIDDRRGGKPRMDAKLASVEKILGAKLSG